MLMSNSTRGPRQVPPPQRPDGSTAPRTSSYSRFIPREELQDFEAWSPDALAGGPAAQRPPIQPKGAAPAPAPAPAAAPPAPEPQIEELLHAARQTGYQDGYRDGLAALDAFKKSFAQQMSAQLGTLVGSFDAEFRALEEQMAQAVSAIAVELARQVVRSEISQRPEHIAQVAHDAVEALQLSARHVRVRVNPEDLPLVMEGAGAEMQAREAQVLPDAEVARGGCKIEADIGSVDATVAARWLQVTAAMGQHSLWEDRRSAEAEADAGGDKLEGKA